MVHYVLAISIDNQIFTLATLKNLRDELMTLIYLISVYRKQVLPERAYSSFTFVLKG